MTLKTATRRTRHLQIGVPAAVLGALATTLTAAPAGATVHADTTAVERPRLLPARVAPAEAAPSTYRVQPGDTVSAIASRFGLRTVDVLTWNGLSWRSVIHPGQTLTLAPSVAPAAPATPQASAPAAAATHQVVSGDTVYAIARKYGTSVDAVLAANGLTRASVIYPGQNLVISGSVGAPTAAAPIAAAAPTRLRPRRPPRPIPSSQATPCSASRRSTAPPRRRCTPRTVSGRRRSSTRARPSPSRARRRQRLHRPRRRPPRRRVARRQRC